MVLNEVVAGLTLLDRLDRFRKWVLTKKNPSVESVAARFVRLFESHGVHRNQIPRFFGHNLSLQDMTDDASLLVKLDEVILDAACTHFAVRREWLDGAESKAHLCHDFYKHPEEFAELIEALKKKNPDGQLHGTLIAPIEENRNAVALLILEEIIGSVGEKAIYRYHICNNWSFSYWKARAYLTACVAIAWKREVYIHGIYARWDQIKKLAEGEMLLGWQGEGISGIGVRRWYAEDMARLPDIFLHGVDPELNNFGITAGLRLWLNLEEKGLMDTGIDEEIRPLFQQELAKYEIK